MEDLEDMRIASNMLWEVTYDVIDECVERVKEAELALEQKRSSRGRSEVGSGRTKTASRTLHALIQDGIEARLSAHSRSPSPGGESQTSATGQYRNVLVFCEGCRCKHTEVAGFGHCPFRRTDSKGKVIAFMQYNGWDPAYWATKSKLVRDIILRRTQNIKDPKAKLEGDMLKSFLAAVDEIDSKRK
jgi:hypothetical protein